MGGVSAGPALNVLLSDTTSGIHVPFGGVVTVSTGPASKLNKRHNGYAQRPGALK
jgi:hypothetical protein